MTNPRPKPRKMAGRPAPLPQPADDANDVKIRERKRPPNAADQMMELARQRFRLGIDETGAPFAEDMEGPNVALPISSRSGAVTSAMSTLLLLYSQKYHKGPNNNAVQSVRVMLEALATGGGSTAEPLPLRVGRDGDSIVIDIGDAEGRAIIVTAKGWEVVDRSPVTFRQTLCTQPLRMPVAPGKGSYKAMRRLFNLDDQMWDFMVNWQVTALVPRIPHVVPIIEGNPGAAKTTATKLIVEPIDPSKGSLNPPPKDQTALDIAAGGSWILALENVSNLTVDISNGLARLITGTSTREREYYTNSDVHVREQRRVVIMNGIHITGILPDLLDRSVSIPLQRIGTAARMTEERCLELFEKAAPAHLGYLLDVLSKAMAYADSGDHELPESGRMADFERWLHFCDLARGTKTLNWYRAQRRDDAIALALDDVLTVALRECLATKPERSAEMSATEWLSNLLEPDGSARRLWPFSSRSFTQRMRTLSAGLELAGWKVDSRTRNNQLVWRIAAPDARSVDG